MILASGIVVVCSNNHYQLDVGRSIMFTNLGLQLPRGGISVLTDKRLLAQLDRSSVGLTHPANFL